MVCTFYSVYTANASKILMQCFRLDDLDAQALKTLPPPPSFPIFFIDPA